MSAPGREEVLLGSSKRAARLALRVVCSAQPKAGRARPFNGLPAPWAGPAASSTHGASRSQSAEPGRGPWARLPEIGSTWGDVTWAGQGSGHAPCPRPLPAPRTPSSRPKRGSPGRGRSSSLAAPSGGGRGWGAVPWAESRAQKQGIPQRGPNPPRGWACTKGNLFFLGMPAPSPTYLQPHSGDRLHPHMAAQTRRGRQQRGCRQPQRSAVKKNLAPTTPCYRLNIIYLTPSDPT